MFVACNTLCFAQEPMETALRQIVELEFDKFELALLEDGQHIRLSEAGDDPEAAVAQLQGGPEPGSVVALPRLRPGRLVRPLTPPAIRRALPAGQIAERRRDHDARRSARHPDRRRGQTVQLTDRNRRLPQRPGAGPAHPLRDA